MAEKTKGRAPAKDATQNTSRTDDDTRINRFVAWINIVTKPSRNRKQKRGWRRSNQGRIDIGLAGKLALLTVTFVFFASMVVL